MCPNGDLMRRQTVSVCRLAVCVSRAAGAHTPVPGRFRVERGYFCRVILVQTLACAPWKFLFADCTFDPLLCRRCGGWLLSVLFVQLDDMEARRLEELNAAAMAVDADDDTKARWGM